MSICVHLWCVCGICVCMFVSVWYICISVCGVCICAGRSACGICGCVNSSSYLGTGTDESFAPEAANSAC